MNQEFVTVLPQTFPGASGQMDVKMLLQPNSLLWLVQILNPWSLADAVSQYEICPGYREYANCTLQAIWKKCHYNICQAMMPFYCYQDY